MISYVWLCVCEHVDSYVKKLHVLEHHIIYEKCCLEAVAIRFQNKYIHCMMVMMNAIDAVLCRCYQ